MNNEQNQRREAMFVSHHQAYGGKKTQKVDQQNQDPNRVLLCACGNGVKCDGICREQHLHRPRYANPMIKTKAAKDYVAGVRKQWAEKCPEAYELPVKSRIL